MSVYQHPSELKRAIEDLRKDLLRDEGPQITTVRNYNFAILPYAPEHEFALRQAIHRLCEELRDVGGWNTGIIPLHTLLLARLRAQEPGFVDALVAREKRLANAADPWRGLRMLKDHVVTALEGPDGLARDVIREVNTILDANRDADRTVIFLGRAGSLYPFYRTSALLKHVAGHTRNVPVVLLYPGTVIGESGLSFMGVLEPDRDYRPRIYR